MRSISMGSMPSTTAFDFYRRYHGKPKLKRGAKRRNYSDRDTLGEGKKEEKGSGIRHPKGKKGNGPGRNRRGGSFGRSM